MRPSHDGTRATRTNPALWEAAKAAACREGNMCAHSARKMQWAVRYYKDCGGGYVGQRKASNSLHRWTRQRWRTSSGRKSEGRRRYLPDAAWAHLTPSQIRRTNAAKARGHREGRQWVPQPRDVAKRASAYRR